MLQLKWNAIGDIADDNRRELFARRIPNEWVAYSMNEATRSCVKTVAPLHHASVQSTVSRALGLLMLETSQNAQTTSVIMTDSDS